MAKELSLNKGKNLKSIMNVNGFQKFSLIDYPGKISAVIFTQGCNFRCPYCHNPELLDINQKPKFKESDIIDFLISRQKQLDAVVITGGEPTLQKDLFQFIQKVKSLGFLVKLDTNGTNPKIIKELLDQKLIDYIAMDIKGPLEKYSQIVQIDVNLNNIIQSINLVRQAPDYEFRTTVTKEQLSIEDIYQISQLVSGAKKYFLQKYIPRLYEKKTKKLFSSYKEDELLSFSKKISRHFDECSIR